MSTYRILVPAGIGDFSWLWSKLSTTGDSYHVEYANANPDRLNAYLNLLPKDKILSFKKSPTHNCFFSVGDLEMRYAPADSQRLTLYSQMREGVLNHIEPNTHLERGGRIETWMSDIPNIDFHYKIEGVLENPIKDKYFIVHLSSTHTFKIWKHYDVNTWLDIIHFLETKTQLMPLFIGGHYDDFAIQVHNAYRATHKSGNSVIGTTPDLISALHLVQQSQFFLGAVSSGLTMLANVLNVPSASWWPRPKLPQSWPALDVPYLWMMWKDPNDDKARLEQFINGLACISTKTEI